MVGGGLQAQDVAAGAPHDRNRSVSSVPRAATPVQPMSLTPQQQQQQQLQQHTQQNQLPPSQQQHQQQQQPLSTGALTGLSRFTAGFPPGPQHNFVSQLPWFTQLQNAQLQSAQLQNAALAGAAMPGGLMHGTGGNADGYAAVMAAAAAGGPRFRSSSFPNDVVNRMQSLSSQPSAGSTRPKVFPPPQHVTPNRVSCTVFSHEERCCMVVLRTSAAPSCLMHVQSMQSSDGIFPRDRSGRASSQQHLARAACCTTMLTWSGRGASTPWA